MSEVQDCVVGTVEAAAILGVSPRTLEGWRLKQIGPKYSRLGPRLVRYRCSDLAAWIEKNSAPAP